MISIIMLLFPRYVNNKQILEFNINFYIFNWYNKTNSLSFFFLNTSHKKIINEKVHIIISYLIVKIFNYTIKFCR